MAKAIGGMFKKIPNAKPDSPLAVHAIDSTAIANYSGETALSGLAIQLSFYK
ncbi:hypothetical protein Q2T40_04625 [Winogradskyella maritima]|nr:hypothetical protein [Winogradskyella maritima]